MTLRDFERHGVYHLCTRGGHDVSIVVIDADVGGATIEGFQCEVRTNDDGGEELVVVDHAVRVNTDAVDFDAHFGAIGGDRFESVSFPEVDRAHSTRYANLAGAYGYEPDVGERGKPDEPDTVDDVETKRRMVAFILAEGEEDERGHYVHEQDFFDEFGDVGQTAIDRGWVEYDETSATIEPAEDVGEEIDTGGDNE